MWWMVGLAACASPPAISTAAPRLPSVVDESSALVASEVHPGVYWTLNDSGGKPVLYAVSARGELLGTVVVAGARNVDWEALAPGGAGALWIGDLGDNRNVRDDLMIYRIDEPAPVDGSVPVKARIAVRHGRRASPPSLVDFNYDVEAMFQDGRVLWILAKHRSDTYTTLYRLPEGGGDGAVVPEEVARFDVGGDRENFGGMVTDAALHPSGRFLAVLTYHGVFVFERPPSGSHWLAHLRNRVGFDQEVTGQCEGITWDGWSLVFTNEGRQIHRISDPFRATAYP